MLRQKEIVPFNERLSHTHVSNKLKRAQVLLELEADLTFTPTLPSSSKDVLLACRDKDGSDISKHEQLYYEGLEQIQKNAAYMHKQKEREHSLNCPFAPSINSRR